MEFKRIGGYIVKGIFRAGTYIVRVYDGIYRIGFTSDGYSRSVNKERQYSEKKEAEYLFMTFYIDFLLDNDFHAIGDAVTIYFSR